MVIVIKGRNRLGAVLVWLTKGRKRLGAIMVKRLLRFKRNMVGAVVLRMVILIARTLHMWPHFMIVHIRRMT